MVAKPGEIYTHIEVVSNVQYNTHINTLGVKKYSGALLSSKYTQVDSEVNEIGAVLFGPT